MKKAGIGLIIIFAFIFCTKSLAFDKAALERVRNKPVLDSSDFEVIDSCLAVAIQELWLTEDFTEISRLRAQIRTTKESNKDSSREQYHKQYYSSAHKYIGQALEQAQMLSDTRQQFRITLNLMILIYELGDSQFVDLIVDKLNDKNMALRYWAVNIIANQQVIEQLNTEQDNYELTVRIIQQLGKAIIDSEPGTLSLIAEFARDIKIPQAGQLLVKIADLRIKQYADWSVKDEVLDAVILKALSQKMSLSSPETAAAERFCQLFSFVIQRYYKGADILTEDNKKQLISVIAETEDKCIKKLLAPQQKIQNALEKKDMEQLWNEHNLLLGEETREGQIPAKFQFIYKRADGRESSAPQTLPIPPEKPNT